jgi:hypothetical protein
VRLLMVCICSLRTQQRAKSQCIKHIPPSMGWLSFFGGLQHHGDQSRSLSWPGLFRVWLVRHSRMLAFRLVLTCYGLACGVRIDIQRRV